MPNNKSTDRTDQDLRSEEVSEIISHVPNWIIRWGITFLFIIFLSILAISWLIKYPDTISAKVVITTDPTPTTLVARREGKLILLTHEGKDAQSGDLLAYVENNAAIEDILTLEKMLTESEVNTSIEDQRTLGEIQPFFSTYVIAKSNYNQFVENRAFEKRIDQLRKQEALFSRSVLIATSQLALSRQELQLAKVQFNADSLLYNQKVIAFLDFNTSKSNWLQKQRFAKNEEAALLDDELQLNETSKQILDLELQQNEQMVSLKATLQNTKAELMARIQNWKESSLLIAPATGRIALLEFFQHQDYVTVGKPIMSIVPDHGTLIARAEMPIAGSGKVKEGQRVNIRLSNYPFEQFGILNGRLKDISLMPNNETYLAEIELANGLTTTSGKILEFRQNLSGNTDIITEDLRLLECFLYQFRAVFYRQ